MSEPTGGAGRAPTTMMAVERRAATGNLLVAPHGFTALLREHDHRLRGLAYKLLGVAPGTLASRLSRARTRLRHLIAEEDR